MNGKITLNKKISTKTIIAEVKLAIPYLYIFQKRLNFFIFHFPLSISFLLVFFQFSSRLAGILLLKTCGLCHERHKIWTEAIQLCNLPSCPVISVMSAVFDAVFELFSMIYPIRDLFYCLNCV